MELTHFSLFTGIGGIDLAAEWAGFKTVGQVEYADYPTKVLEKHWPNVPRWRDIRDVTAKSANARGMRTVDLISGGFPCQPFSNAGKRKGKKDDRYLWPEMLRVIQELKPTWVLGENVAGLVSMAESKDNVKVENRTIVRNKSEDIYNAVYTQQEIMLFRKICRELEAIGYEVQPFTIPACGVNAPHRRERVWIVAFLEHSANNGQPGMCKDGRSIRKNVIQRRQEKSKSKKKGESIDLKRTGTPSEHVANSNNSRCIHGQNEKHTTETRQHAQCKSITSSQNVPNTTGERWEKSDDETRNTCKRQAKWESWTADSFNKHIWEIEPDVGRVANGVSARVDRLKCLGNAVVPQQVYPILKAIYEIESSTHN